MTSRSPSSGRERDAAATSRCAHCGARLTGTDRWCGLCHTPVRQQVPMQGARPVEEMTAEPELELTDEPTDEPADERIDQLLERLAASEASHDPAAHLGALAGLHGKGGGLALAGVLGLILLAGGMLALYVLGTLI